MAVIEAFHDVVFPLSVAFGSTVTRERKVEVVQFASGREQRNARLAHSRRTYDAGNGIRSIADLRVVLDFYEARRGPLTSFRFRDPVDNSSAANGGTPLPGDQLIGTGNGVNARFALTKKYGAGADAYLRPVRRPIAGTVRVAVNGTEALPSDFSLDSATGEIVFIPGKIPGNGAAVTAGFSLHVEVRFASETLSANLTAFDAGEVPSVPLVEVLA
jgi:uncharacterized protein (TIGR02217 family)